MALTNKELKGDLLFAADIEYDGSLHELAGYDEEGGGWTEAPDIIGDIL